MINRVRQGIHQTWYIRDLSGMRPSFVWRLFLLLAIITLLFLFDFPSRAEQKQAKPAPLDPPSIPTLAQIWPSNHVAGVSGFCHALMFYGLGPTDLPSLASGKIVLRALLEEDFSVQMFGRSPFVRTRHGVRYFLTEDPVFHTEVGESHRDQCLATFGALNLSLDTPLRLKTGIYSISNVLQESIANFSFDQHEPAWTTLAYCKYLPPSKTWTNRFNERFSFSDLASHLMNLDLNQQSCGGTHIVQALIRVFQADAKFQVLNPSVQKELNLYLGRKANEASTSCHPDGHWSKRWCKEINNENTGDLNDFDYQLLITGHVLEIFKQLPTDKKKANSIEISAAKWLAEALKSQDAVSGKSLICPFTHAAMAARETLKSVEHGK